MSKGSVVNPKDVVIKVTEIEDEKGKPIVVVLPVAAGGRKELWIMSDVRCMDKDTDVCNKCRLRYQCYSGNVLKIDYLDTFDPNDLTPLSRKIEAHLRRYKPEVDSKQGK